jgi:hypothetical protein
MAQISQISKKNKSKLPDVHDKFYLVAKNLEGFCFFFYLVEFSLKSSCLHPVYGLFSPPSPSLSEVHKVTKFY